MLGEPEGRQAAAVSARRESRKPGLETSDLGAVSYARGQVARSGQQSPVTQKACKSHPLPRSGIARRRMSRRLMLLTVPECLLCPLPGIIFLLAPLANSSSPLRGPAQTPLLLFQISTDPSLYANDPPTPTGRDRQRLLEPTRTVGCVHTAAPPPHGVSLQSGGCLGVPGTPSKPGTELADRDERA